MSRTRLIAISFLGAVQALLLTAAAQTAVPVGTYIVTYDQPPTAEQVETLWGIALGVHPYVHLPDAAVVLAPTDVRLAANFPGVRRVYPARSMIKMLHQSTRTIRADQVWALGYNGAGIGIAVIDTGIDGTHPDLCAAPAYCLNTPVKTVQNVKFVGRQDLADPVVTLEDQIDTDTTSGHGSHVAGIAAGLGVASSNGPGYYQGVAPGARLIGLGTGELLSVENVLAAFDWVLEHKDDPRYNIKVVNNSWGPGKGTPFDSEDPVQRAIVASHDAGLSVVFGAGNDGPSTDTLNAFSVNPDAFSAAAGTKQGQIAFFSSRGVPGNPFWHPTATTPGYNIVSVRAKSGFVADVADATGPNPDPIATADLPYYASGSGTSMASPHMAGIIALMQQASFEARGVYLTPDQAKNILQNTAVSQDPARGPGGLPLYQQYTMGAGYADALAAVQAAKAGTATGAYDPHVQYDVRTFSGQVGPAFFIATQSFASTFQVAAGALTLDVMADWSVVANDVDIDLYAPDGSLNHSTFLQCDPNAEPNGFSSFCTEVPNERITVAAPAPGMWRAVIHGSFSAVDTVNGAWSAAYPAGTALPAAPAAASVTVTAATPAGVAGQGVGLTATVRDGSGNVLPNAAVAWTSAGVGSIQWSEGITHVNGGAQASAVSDASGTQTVTASAGGVSGSAAITWVGVTVPGPASTPGHASGGGWFMDPGKRTFGFYAEYQAGASGPAGDLSFNDHQNTQVRATGVNQIVVTGNQATVRGPATLNGDSGYHFQLDIADNGPGSSDSFHLVVTSDLDPLFRYETGGTLGGGNLTVGS